jgi:ABC-2 type transport system permease protein
MDAFLAMVRRQLWETRWQLGISALALFGFSWLFVFVTSRTEDKLRQSFEDGNVDGRMRIFRSMAGEGMDFSSAAIEMTGWIHPLILLPVVIWSLTRASISPAGEIERGTLDLTLSRPASRSAYLGAQLLVATAGLVLLMAALVAGNVGATRVHPVDKPPTMSDLSRPALNLAALGLVIYAYTILCSACDSVRWRPVMIGSVITLASFVVFVVVNLPALDDWSWKPLLQHLTIFRAYNPVDAVGKATHLAFNVSLLLGISALAIAPAFVAFQWRDLPANG